MTQKLYSMEVALYTTAYIKAASPEEAKRKLEQQLLSSTIEVSEDSPYGFICGWDYDRLLNIDDTAFDVTLSPAMTPDHILSDEPELVWPEEEDEK